MTLINYDVFTPELESVQAHVTCNFNCFVKSEAVLEVTGSVQNWGFSWAYSVQTLRPPATHVQKAHLWDVD